MSKLDPFLIPMPTKWANDPELEPTIRYLWLWLQDAYIKMGGGEDLITNITNSESFETSSSAAETADNFKHNEQIEDYIIIPEPAEDQEDHLYTPVKEFRAKIAIANYTAVDHDFVEGRNGVTIKLDANAGYNDQVITGNGDSSTITIDGNGIELRHNSKRVSKLILQREGTSVHWYLFSDGSERYWRSS